MYQQGCLEVSLKRPKEYLGAFKEGHRFADREFVDEEFSEKLLKLAQAGSQEAKAALEWLTRFNNEFYRGVFIEGKEPTEMRSARYARSVDVMAKQTLEISNFVLISCAHTEDELIELIDLKNAKNKAIQQ